MSKSAISQPHPPSDCIVLHYRTGWSSPLVHLSEDDGHSWKQNPFLTSRISPIGPDFLVAKLPAAPLRFVLTNGEGLWDNPSPDCDERYVRRVHDGDNYFAPCAGEYVLYSGKLSRKEGILRRSGLAIVTDIDGTLFGCDQGLALLNDLWCRELALSGVFLVYNTGRSIESVVSLIREHRHAMPVPLAAVTRVGGYIHWFRRTGTSGGRADIDSTWTDFDAEEPYLSDEEYRQHLVSLEGWDHNCMPQCRKVINSLIEDGTEALWLHDGTEDSCCVQISISIHVDSIDTAMAKMKEELAHLPIKFITSGNVCHWSSLGADILFSERLITGIALTFGDYRYLDLTIGSGGKLGGTKYVVSQLPGESGNLENAIFCGDSGNDIDALMGDVKGVVVGNAQPDLLLAHESVRSQATPPPHKVLITQSGFAGGIVEGVKLHGFI